SGLGLEYGTPDAQARRPWRAASQTERGAGCVQQAQPLGVQSALHPRVREYAREFGTEDDVVPVRERPVQCGTHVRDVGNECSECRAWIDRGFHTPSCLGRLRAIAVVLRVQPRNVAVLRTFDG